MPLSELYRTAKGKVEFESSVHSQPKVSNYAANFASLLDNEFVELVWENGQLMMQGQSNRPQKGHTANVGRNEEDAVIPKTTGRYGNENSIMNDFALPGSSRQMHSVNEEELVRFLNCPVDDYGSEFFSELSGLTLNANSHNNVTPIGKSNGGGHFEQKGSSKYCKEVPELNRSRSNQLHSLSIQKWQDSGTLHSLRISDFNRNRNSNQNLASNGNGIKRLGKDEAHNTSGVINFSNFLQPASLAKANQSISIMDSNNPVEVMELTSASSNFREDAFKMNRPQDHVLHRTSSLTASTIMGGPSSDKSAEPVIASSSVCSANSAGEASNDVKILLKRKSRDTDESENTNEDLEDESMDIKKSSSARGGKGTKRSRAAEVHNLSERRRRDRINEKMRLLQELIPNCNKVDKASMLDEAIEYLKTLQLQVQVMSMGAGIYMPQMMLHNGMHHMHAQHMANFSPMGGMSMGMDMGFGLEMHGSQFPCPPNSGPSTLPTPAGPGFSMFGVPGQEPPMSSSHAPIGNFPGGTSTKSASLLFNSTLQPNSMNETSTQCPAPNQELELCTMKQIVDQNGHPIGN